MSQTMTSDPATIEAVARAMAKANNTPDWYDRDEETWDAMALAAITALRQQEAENG